MPFQRARAAFRSLVVKAARSLPDGPKLAVMQGLTMQRRMDYPRTPLYLNVDSSEEYFVRLRSCSKEPDTVAWLEGSTRPDDTVYDVGANVGAYSLVAARGGQGVARVYAFEPGFANYAQLCRNVLLNGCGGQIVPMPIALADQNGVRAFRISNLNTGAAAQGLDSAGTASAGTVHSEALHSVMVWRLDDLIPALGLEPPNLIKIDVDGAEVRVLEGARETLRNPALRSLLVETDRGSDLARRVFALLEEAGFRLESENAKKKVANYIFSRNQPPS